MELRDMIELQNKHLALQDKHMEAMKGWAEVLKEMNRLNLQLSEVPKKILEAVNAEQLRCGKIAEAFWNEDDKLNADLRVKLTQAEKSMAYMISTNIRAMRWREENFTEKPKCDHEYDYTIAWPDGKPQCKKCHRSIEKREGRPQNEPH